MRDELARLLRHSAIYGLAGLASRIASVLLLPFLTRELGPSSYGRIETMVALIAVLVPLLRAGVATAFFRFYYERELAPDRDLVVRTSFWFTVLGAGVGLVVGVAAAPAIASFVVGDDAYANLVRVAFVMLAVQLLYEQLTALYRVEERSVAFTVASLANLVITVVATIVAVFVLDDGATGALAGNAIGTAVVLVVLIWQRRASLRPAFDRDLVRRMNRFGLPLLPAGLAIWVVDFADRLLLGRIVDQHEVGLYAVGVKIASAMVLVQLAFRTAWPAFAYSLEEGNEARRTFAYVLTYTSLLGCWLSLGLGLLAPWLVDWLAAPEFAPAERVVAPLAFSGALLVAYTTLSIAASRANNTQRYWQVAVVGAAVNVALNLLLIPTYGMEGAAAATVAAYVVLAGGMALLAQRLYPVPYEWRRLTIAVGVGVLLYAAGRLADAPFAGALAPGPRLPRRAGAAGVLPAGRTASPRDPGRQNTPEMTLDLHAHVLAGVDDGPDTIEDALDLLRALQDEGVTSVAATPHVHPAYPTTVQMRDERLAQVQEAAAAAGLTIVVVPGGELDLEYAASYDDDQIRAWALGGGPAVLVEFPWGPTWPLALAPTCRDLRLRGFLPIVAHPERARPVQQRPERLDDVIASGAVCQITNGSLAGRFGETAQRTAFDLLRERRGHLIASDAHGASSRRPSFDRRPQGAHRRAGRRLRRRPGASARRRSTRAASRSSRIRWSRAARVCSAASEPLRVACSVRAPGSQRESDPETAGIGV